MLELFKPYKVTIGIDEQYKAIVYITRYCGKEVIPKEVFDEDQDGIGDDLYDVYILHSNDVGFQGFFRDFDLEAYFDDFQLIDLKYYDIAKLILITE